MRFRIYYEDREPYTGDPFLAPPAGVLAVAQENPGSARGYRVMRGGDAWIWQTDRWRNCDQIGLWDYLFNYTGPKAVLLGRMVADDDFHAAVSRASKEGLDEQ